MIIEVKGEKLRFDTLAIRQFLQMVDLANYFQTANYAMCWGGLYSYWYAHLKPLGQPIAWKFVTCMEWVETLTQDEVNKVSLVMAEVEAYKKLIPEDKKKVKKTAPLKST